MFDLKRLFIDLSEGWSLSNNLTAVSGWRKCDMVIMINVINDYWMMDWVKAHCKFLPIIYLEQELDLAPEWAEGKRYPRMCCVYFSGGGTCCVIGLYFIRRFSPPACLIDYPEIVIYLHNCCCSHVCTVFFHSEISNKITGSEAVALLWIFWPLRHTFLWHWNSQPQGTLCFYYSVFPRVGTGSWTRVILIECGP